VLVPIVQFLFDNAIVHCLASLLVPLLIYAQDGCYYVFFPCPSLLDFKLLHCTFSFTLDVQHSSLLSALDYCALCTVTAPLRISPFWQPLVASNGILKGVVGFFCVEYLHQPQRLECIDSFLWYGRHQGEWTATIRLLLVRLCRLNLYFKWFKGYVDVESPGGQVQLTARAGDC